jgi:hypothetical protein
VTYLDALTLTYALETPVVLAAGWFWRCGAARSLMAAALASGLTHPLAWQVAMSMSPEAYVWGWYAIEAAVCCVEAFVIRSCMRLPLGRAAAVSVLANGVSALAGRFLL